jgi:hypothetical protein
MCELEKTHVKLKEESDWLEAHQMIEVSSKRGQCRGRKTSKESVIEATR